MDATLPRTGFARLPVRPVILLALVALLVVALAVAVVGSRKSVPAPFGLADNGQLAYVEDGDIYVRDSLTGDGRRLIDTGADDEAPYYSPDGTHLVFTAIESDGTAYDYFARADGTGVVKALPDPIVGDGHWAWSPDSRHLAVVNGRVNESTGILHIASVDGAGAIALDLPDLLVTSPSWLPPAGDRLLFRGQRINTGSRGTSTVDLYTVKSDGTDLRALGTPVTPVFGADWDNSGPVAAPDGSRIAYNQVEPLPRGSEPNGHFRVHLVNPDGTNDIALPGPAEAGVQEAWPVYSPDGASILVHRWTWTSEPDGGYGWLAIMPADGSEPARDIGPRIPGGENTGLNMTWSPDGTRVLMRASNLQKVYSIDPVTGEYEELPWATDLPDWQRVAP